MSDVFNVTMAGLPATGKSTYLVALYIAMMDGKSELKRGNFADDREYMNDLSTQIYDGVEVGRTLAGSRSSLSLSVETPSGKRGLLVVPDRSGEVWDQLVVDRVWDESLLKSTRESSGICLFINAETFRHDPDLHAVAELDDLYPPAAGSVPAPAPTSHPEQVKLTDLIQSLIASQPASPTRISVVLSAFDSVVGMNPVQWIAANAPLLDQFLRANSPTINAAFYGVSAQGGRFGDADMTARIESTEPVDRAWARDGDGNECPIEAPMLWAMAEI